MVVPKYNLFKLKQQILQDTNILIATYVDKIKIFFCTESMDLLGNEQAGLADEFTPNFHQELMNFHQELMKIRSFCLMKIQFPQEQEYGKAFKKLLHPIQKFRTNLDNFADTIPLQLQVISFAKRDIFFFMETIGYQVYKLMVIGTFDMNQGL